MTRQGKREKSDFGQFTLARCGIRQRGEVFEPIWAADSNESNEFKFCLLKLSHKKQKENKKIQRWRQNYP